MKIYVVQNSGGTLLGVLKTKPEAKELVKIGNRRWNEDWSINTVKLDKIESWVLAGGDGYRAKKKCKC
jgi:hypothetical protein